jgi:AraC family transcriptional regulator
MMDIDCGYDQCMNQVYDYVDRNLSEDLSLGVLARVSGYSPYHFHRIFHAMTGKSVHDFVFERRLAAAAGQLLYDTASITQIALEHGFMSSASFTRCFRQYFGCSPSYYRKNKLRKRPVQSEPKQYAPNASFDELFTVASFTDMHVAGIVCQGLSEDFQNATIEGAFQRLFIWLKHRKLAKEGLLVMGITLDTPEVLSLQDCRYFACAAVEDGVKSEGEICVRTFATKGSYICFTLERSQQDFAAHFFGLVDYLYGYFLVKRGFYPDNRPFFEFYKQRDAAVEITFCVPIK